MIDFKEDVGGYKSRTIKNATADLTIAIAADFSTGGEVLTQKAAKMNGKRYLGIPLNSLHIDPDRVNQVVRVMNECEVKSLNIAGNGLYTLKGKYTQDQLDEFVLKLLKKVTEHPDLKNKLEFVRTGGQTGIDESGAKAGDKLGIPTLILAPKGWQLRTLDGRDVFDEHEFKMRFARTETKDDINEN